VRVEAVTRNPEKERDQALGLNTVWWQTGLVRMAGQIEPGAEFVGMRQLRRRDPDAIVSRTLTGTRSVIAWAATVARRWARVNQEALSVYPQGGGPSWTRSVPAERRDTQREGSSASRS